jgi:hypothetical protein
VQQNAFSAWESLKIHGCLVRLNLSKQHAFFHGIAHFNVPFGNHTFGHGVAQAGHIDY